MYSSKIKKTVLSLVLASGLVAGNVAAISAIAAPSPIVIPGKGIIQYATSSVATGSTATGSNSGRGGSGSSRSSNSYKGSSNKTPNPANTTNSSNTAANSTNAKPTGPSNSSATKAAATKGKLNVPKTADTSVMGLYAGLLGISIAGGAVLLTTKKRED